MDISGFIEGADRSQSSLFPERLEDGIAEDNSGYLIDLFAEDLDLVELGFRRTVAAEMGRSGCASVGFRNRCLSKSGVSTNDANARTLIHCHS